MGMPLLVGAGLGAGTNLLRGKGVGGILKGAALGGALGGIGGGLNGLANGGSFLEGAGLNGLSGATANAGIGEAVIPGSIESGGDVVLGADGVYRNAANFQNVFGNPVFTGGEGLLSNGMSNITDMMPQSLSEYATPQNLLGVGQVLSAMPSNQAPLQNIGSGQISQGQMPQYTPFNTGTPAWKKRNQ
jgi:hypothetical protein